MAKSCSLQGIFVSEEIEREIQEVREAICLLYGQVKEASLPQQGKEAVSQTYDPLVAKKV